MADSKNPIAERNIEIFAEYEDEQGPWFTRQNKIQAKRRGEIYSSAQEKKIRALNLEPVGMNLCKPSIDTWVPDLLSDKSSISVTARDDGNEDIAYFHQVVIDAFMEQQKWIVFKEPILQEMLGEGIGVAHIDRADNIFGTKVRPCSYQKLRWRSHPDDLFWEDLMNIVRIEIMTVKEVITKYGVKYDESWIARTGIIETNSIYNKIFLKDKGQYQLKRRNKKEDCEVAVLEVSDVQYVNYEKLLFYDKDKNEIVETMDVPILPPEKQKKEYTDEVMRNAYSYFYDEVGPGRAESLIKGLNENRERAIKPLSIKQVIKTVSAGAADIATEILPCKRLNYVPFINELIGYPEGELRHVIPLQDSLNNTELMLMQNGRVVSNPVVFTFGDSVSEKDYMKARSTLGGGVVKITSKGLSDPEKLRPIIERTEALGSHFVTMIGLFMQQHEYISGTYSSFQGNPQGSPETNSTVQTLNNRAYQRALPKAKRVQFSQVATFEVAKSFIAKFAERDVMVRLKEVSDDIVNNFAIEKPEEAQGRRFMARKVSNGPYKLEFPMNKTVTQKNKEMVINDFKSTSDLVEYSTEAAVDMHNTRERTAFDIREFVKQSGNPNLAAVGMKYLGMLDSNPIIKQMVKELDVVLKLQQSLTSLQEELKLEKSKRLSADKKTETARTAEATAKFSSSLAMKGNKLLNDFQLLYDRLNQTAQSGAEDQDALMANIKEIQPEILSVIEGLRDSLNESADQAEQQLTATADSTANQ